MPVIFILMLQVAFASSVKNDDRVDNSFAFGYDAEAAEIVAATSSKRFKFDDDVDFSVTVTEADPLLGRVKFRLLAKEPVRYEGTITFEVIEPSGKTAYEESRAISFTLRPKQGQKVKAFKFPFTVPSGHYRVDVTFSR